MRADAWLLSSLLAQATDSHASPWATLILSTLGAGGVLSVLLREYLKDRSARERATAAEEQARREAKHRAELEQIEALTLLARGVPEQLRLLGDRFDKAIDKVSDVIRTHDKQIEANTIAVNMMIAETRDENRVLLDAVATELGVRRDRTVKTPVDPRAPLSRREPLESQPGQHVG